MIHNLIFDFGQVLVRFEPDEIAAPYIPDPADRALACPILFDRFWWDRFDAGTLTEEQALPELLPRLPERLRAPAARVLLEWHQNLPPVPGMWDLVGRCRSEFGARVFLLSNISLDFADRGAPRYPVLSQMEGCVFSAKVGLVKPKPAIFDYTLNKFGLRAEETLFIDDSPRNLAGAAACGIAGYRFEGDAAALGNYLSGLFSSRNR